MKQIIKFAWQEWEPHLILQSDGSMERINLFKQDVSFRLGERSCIGYFKNGKYHRCPDNNLTDSERSCPECQKKDDFFRCIKCNGTSCMNDKMRIGCEKNNYFIYLAAFDSLVKIGISFEHRLMERLVEQGADFGAKIAFVNDGKNVREIEQRIKKYLNITDRVNGKQKHERLLSDPNQSIVRICNAINRLRGSGFSLIRPEIFDLRRFYHMDNIVVNPKIRVIRANSSISGRVVAAKGNILVFDDNTCVNAHKLVGMEVDYLKDIEDKISI